MFPYSTILGPLFWIIMGLIYALIIASARVWVQDLGLKMNWWKWMMVVGWFCLLNFSIAGGFTLIGEREPRAGLYFLGLFVTISVITGVGLGRFLWAGRGKHSGSVQR